ncbi:hypothetical protein HD806DRAFT_452424 [Xylariaceae sp. AK1471]|nr:hypothetical protein HD806DRAFT_452424 [Xylariaceae sp. AK1471]
MLLKKPTIVLSSCPNLSVPGVPSPVSCITSSCPGNCQRPRAPRSQYTGLSRRDAKRPSTFKWYPSSTRFYASVSGLPPKHPLGSSVDHSWPSSPNPTPYEIFSHPRDAKYNKALFYELVKIYHPDRHHTADSAIAHAVRLERYRLIVAANEILSDPIKRRAYDLHGAGWNGNRPLQSLYRENYQSWRNEPGNPSRNATWEDWERWHRERNGDKQQPQTRVFMSNELFVVVLCSFVVLGSLTQARRANTTTMNIVEMRDQKHAAISGDMKRRQDEKAPLNRHERVESFLQQRDSWNFVSSVNNSRASASQGK